MMKKILWRARVLDGFRWSLGHLFVVDIPLRVLPLSAYFGHCVTEGFSMVSLWKCARSWFPSFPPFIVPFQSLCTRFSINRQFLCDRPSSDSIYSSWCDLIAMCTHIFVYNQILAIAFSVELYCRQNFTQWERKDISMMVRNHSESVTAGAYQKHQEENVAAQ